MIDIYESRRTYYKKCAYYTRDIKNYELSEYVLNNKPDGYFYAKESQNRNNRQSPINNAFVFSADNTVIETRDDIDNIKAGCVVVFRGYNWYVDSVQMEIHNKESEFSNEIHATYYLSLRK